MSEIPRSRPLGDVALGFAIASVVTIPVTVMIAAVSSLVWRSALPPIWLLIVQDANVLAMPVLALTAVVAGHMSRRRGLHNRNSSAALFIGYGVLAFMALVAFLGVITFMTLR